MRIVSAHWDAGKKRVIDDTFENLDALSIEIFIRSQFNSAERMVLLKQSIQQDTPMTDLLTYESQT